MTVVEIPYPPLPSFFIGVVAAALAWHLNKLVAYLPARGMLLLPPFIEEVVKTTPAVVLETNIIFTHFFFGAVEGLYEAFTAGGGGYLKGVSALFSHTAFGTVTALVYMRYGALVPALAAGYLAHATWNCFIFIISGPETEAGG